MALVVAEVAGSRIALQAVVDFTDRSSGIQLESRPILRCRLRLAAEQHLEDAVPDFVDRLVHRTRALMDDATHAASPFRGWESRGRTRASHYRSYQKTYISAI